MTDLSALRQRIEAATDRKFCAECGKAFTKHPTISRKRWATQRFCSPSCGGTASNKSAVLSPEQMKRQLLDRHIVDPETGCWNYQAVLNSHGYAGITWGGKKHLGHRVAYELLVGTIPDGLVVCHRCDNRACINPKHLFLGTPTENNADRDRKSRQAKGEASGRAKLSEDDVLIIRASTATVAELARQYGVGETTIGAVRARRTWRHV